MRVGQVASDDLLQPALQVRQGMDDSKPRSVNLVPTRAGWSPGRSSQRSRSSPPPAGLRHLSWARRRRSATEMLAGTKMGLETPETERVQIPAPEPLQVPVPQPTPEPVPAPA
jgi:hypothetical protein